MFCGRGAGLGGEQPRAGRRAEGSEEAAQAAAGGGALQRAGGWHRRRRRRAQEAAFGERARETRKKAEEEERCSWLDLEKLLDFIIFWLVILFYIIAKLEF